MLVKTADNEFIKWTFELQNPPKIFITKWYVLNASEVAYVAVTQDGNVVVSIPTSNHVALSQVDDDFLLGLVPRETWAIVDFATKKVIFREKGGAVQGLWEFRPRISSNDINDPRNFKVYLGGNGNGKFISCYGSQPCLVLALQAQILTWKLRGGGPVIKDRQTLYGKALAMNLSLIGAGLLPIKGWSGKMEADMFCCYGKQELPIDCLDRLYTMTTQKAKIGNNLAEPVDEDEDVGDLYGISMEFSRAIKADFVDIDAAPYYDGPFPILIDFSPYRDAYLELDLVDTITLVGRDEITVRMLQGSDATEEFLLQLSVIFEGCFVDIRTGIGSIMALDLTGKKRSEEKVKKEA